MEDRENNLHQVKNDSNKLFRAAKQDNSRKRNELQQKKRLPLGNLSTNTSLGSFQDKTKQTALPLAILQEKKKTSTSDQLIDRIIADFPHQSFKIYTDQEHHDESVPWPCMDMTIQSTSPEKEGSSAIINLMDDILDVSCTKEHVSDVSDSDKTDTILPEYELEVHNYLKQTEQKHRPSHSFMYGQPLINNGMRAILVDWLVEVAEEYRLVPETLYLTINYIDRFLSSKVIIDPSKLQLVGVACMLIASKIEEIYPPEISEFVYITNSTYTTDQVKQMERLVLRILAFDLSVPTALSFLDKYERCVDLPGTLKQKLSNLTRYFCELMLQDADVQWKHLPSAVAASSVVLALNTLGFTSWFPLISQKIGFDLADLHSCISNMHKIVSNAENSNLQATREKYKEFRFGSVANITSCEPVLA